MQYGLIGRKLSHSISSRIHAEFGDSSYIPIELEPSELDGFFRHSDFQGINVTIPYKNEVLKYCDELDNYSSLTGSVNTIIRNGGSFSGYNTDFLGFCELLNYNNIKLSDKNIVILGSGGTSKTVYAAAKSSKAKSITVISRNGKNNYENINYNADILINTTPVGMFPNNMECAVDITKFKNLHAVIDVIYNPLNTKLILDAKKQGIKTANGLSMLVFQAAASYMLFHNLKINNDYIKETIEKIEKELINFVLIGMPGCGKSSAGKLLSQRIGKKFIDSDMEIENIIGKSPEDIIKNESENIFRKIEKDVIFDISKINNAVISTGGGVILNESNIEALKQNGIIIFIKRDLNKLDIKNRPLSNGATGLDKLFKSRLPLYEKHADYSVDNNGNIEDTVKRILLDVYG